MSQTKRDVTMPTVTLSPMRSAFAPPFPPSMSLVPLLNVCEASREGFVTAFYGGQKLRVSSNFKIPAPRGGGVSVVLESVTGVSSVLVTSWVTHSFLDPL